MELIAGLKRCTVSLERMDMTPYMDAVIDAVPAAEEPATQQQLEINDAMDVEPTQAGGLYQSTYIICRLFEIN